MAAEARHYEKKKMTYSSRQIEEKYGQQNSSRSCDTSPYRPKSRSSSHFSPSRRKRPYSPKSSKQSSLYEDSKKKNREKDIRKNECMQSNCDWSKHISSSGKTYYYNRLTEQSQWEPPKEFLQRERSDTQSSGSSSQDSRGSRDSRDDGIKDSQNSSRYKSLRDYRKSQDSKSYNSRENRECRDFWNRSTRSNNNKNSDLRPDRGINGSISGFKSVGHSTPNSKTSSNCSYRTPDTTYINGSLQDISPPDTPTNDDNPSVLSNISPVTLCTPLGCSPLLNSSLSNHIIPMSLHSPLLSPSIIAVTSSEASSFLHPLQQALLLKQQVSSISTKEIYKSPKLPTVKPHLSNSGLSLSPQISTVRKSSKSCNSPLLSFPECSTPPPPPPLKDNMRESLTKSDSRAGNINNERSNKHERFSRNNSYLSHTPEHDSRTKTFDHPSNENSNSIGNHNPLRHSVDLLSLKSSKNNLNSSNDDTPQKRLSNLSKGEMLNFSELPALDKYSQYLSTNKSIEMISDINSSYYGNVLEKQASACCDETLSYLQSDGCRTKFSLIISKLYTEIENCRSEINLARLSSLHAVADKLESLQDLTMNSRTPRENKLINRKKQQDSVISDDINKTDKKDILVTNDITDEKKLNTENGINIRKVDEHLN